MNGNRICPQCGIEYLPHIYQCADCGTTLLLYEEYRTAKDEKKRVAEKFIEDGVVVREGDLNWIGELRTLLIDAGIPCAIAKDECCKSGCKQKFYLVAANADLERARQRIEEYFAVIYPEIQASNELASQGKCPACGSSVIDGATECADCGLPLVIIEEEDDRSSTEEYS